MKKLYSSPDSAEVELIKNILGNVGIECEVRNGALSQIVPAPPFYEELWVSEEDFLKASEVLGSWQSPAGAALPRWKCAKCGEVIEAQFSSCWKCGAPRSAPD